MIWQSAQRGLVGLTVWLCCILVCAVAVPLLGQTQEVASAKQDTVKILPFSREVEEEEGENDKKLSQEEIDGLLAATRGFDVDRHSAFTATEQSRMMQQISEFAGVPYQVGGNSKDGIDCASFVALVYKSAASIELPRVSLDQFYYCQPVSGGEGHFGDLVFFNTTGQRASHVGIYLGNQLFAHASVSLGVTISTLESSYYKKRFDGLRRLDRK